MGSFDGRVLTVFELVSRRRLRKKILKKTVVCILEITEQDKIKLVKTN